MAVRCSLQGLRWAAAAGLTLVLGADLLTAGAQARPARGGVGGPASGAGVRPGAGFGAPGAGLTPRPGVGAGGVGGPASGAGVRPGAGWGAPGAGLTPRPGVGAGGVGGPASGAGVRPGAGWGAPGVGLTRAPSAAYGAAAYHPGWAGGGYWAARPWTSGWYGVRPLGWGVAGLATGAVIADAVNSAADQQSTVFVVPQTSYQLNYATVLAAPPSGVRFSYGANGVLQTAQGDCQGGQLNGLPASSVEAAQLLNAACVVAYGSGQ